MKKILMAAVALICMTMSGIILSSCGSDDNDTPTTVTYSCYSEPGKLTYVEGEEATFYAFQKAIQAALDASVASSVTISDAQVIMCVQAVVDVYDNGVIAGSFDLRKSYDGGSNYTTVKTFTMHLNSKYQQ